jgi:predicted PurR-regulated permease PerM
MNTAAEVLLIVVSSVLSIFLVVLIIFFVYAIKVIKQLRRITERADNVTASVEAAATTFEKAASPLALVKLLSNIVDQTSKMRRKKD